MPRAALDSEHKKAYKFKELAGWIYGDSSFCASYPYIVCNKLFSLKVGMRQIIGSAFLLLIGGIYLFPNG